MTTMAVRTQTAGRPLPVAGILAVVLWVIGIVLLESAGTPDDQATAQVIAGHYEENSGRILAGSFVFMLGVAAFVWFLGGLRARVAEREVPLPRLASVVFGAGLLTAAMAMAFMAPEAAAAFGADQLDRSLEPATAEALSILGDGFFIAAEAALVAFFLACAVASLRLRAFPTWLGWASLVLAVAAVLPWIGWAVVIWGLPLWVLAVSIWVIVRPRPEGEERDAVA
ncbi:MAG TPA: hypothetical protein VHK22_01780 [Gaiellaceae bacterium]|nr:hypothetical protein [Gaiellaceae bacterium]